MNSAPSSRSLRAEAAALLERLGVAPERLGGGDLKVVSPIDGSVIAEPPSHDVAALGRMIDDAGRAFAAWRTVPAPRRGELLRLFGEELRAHKSDLGRLVSIEAGKIVQEGLGEVQEMIDICDFAVGLSRQLY